MHKPPELTEKGEPRKSPSTLLAKHDTQPMSIVSIRQQLLLEAGYDHAKQVEIMHEVLESAKADMKTAMKETPGFYMGKLEDVHKQPDHAARAKARDQLVDYIGANDKGNSKQQSTVKPDIPLPPWMLNMTFNNGSLAPVVVEAGSQGAPIESVMPVKESVIEADLGEIIPLDKTDNDDI